MTVNLEAIKARHDAYYKCKISVGAYLNSLRTDIPALVAEVERLRAELKETNLELDEVYEMLSKANDTIAVYEDL